MKTILIFSISFLLSLKLSAQCQVLVSTIPACNLCDGSATASPVGIPPFTYYWSTNPPSTAPSVTSLCPDTYTVVITDSTGCTVTDTFILNPVIFLTVTTTPASCSGCPDGTATATPSGGSPPYSYLWNNGEVTPTIMNLIDGVYMVCVYDAAGCQTCDTASVSFPSAIEVNGDREGVGIYPNPVSGEALIRTVGNFESLRISDLSGREILIEENFSGQTEFLLDVSGIKSGVYLVAFNRSNGSRIVKKLVITK